MFEWWAEETGLIELKKKHKNLSIDRVDPEKGYEIGNIVVLTSWENSYKSDYVATKMGRSKITVCESAKEGDPF